MADVGCSRFHIHDMEVTENESGNWVFMNKEYPEDRITFTRLMTMHLDASVEALMQFRREIDNFLDLHD